LDHFLVAFQQRKLEGKIQTEIKKRAPKPAAQGQAMKMRVQINP
jgi:hypothetical protein